MSEIVVTRAHVGTKPFYPSPYSHETIELRHLSTYSQQNYEPFSGGAVTPLFRAGGDLVKKKSFYVLVVKESWL